MADPYVETPNLQKKPFLGFTALWLLRLCKKSNA